MAGSMSIALQGLNVAMRGFETASSNIANVNTPGYSRQQVELSSRTAPEQGVQVLNVNRIADTFATQQLWSSQASLAASEQLSFFSGQVDNLLADPTSNISMVTDQFFSALQAGVDDPASVPNREVILAQSKSLASRFVEVDRQFLAQSQAADASLQSAVGGVNQMAGLVAKLNDEIRFAESRGEPANELKDHRDAMVLSISEKIGVSVQTTAGGGDINLFVGNGQPLVLGGSASTLEARQGDPDINDFDVVVKNGDRLISLGDEIRTGEIGGILEFKNEVLIPSWNELGRLAIVFSDSVNQQQTKGIDLNGNMAGNWFSDPARVGEVRAFSDNAVPMGGATGVIINDSGLLKASDYQVKFGDNGDFTVTRNSDGEVFTQKDFTERTAAEMTEYEEGTLSQSQGVLKLNLDGLEITLESSVLGQDFAKNDRILVQPVRSGAKQMEVALSSGRELAFASPVRVETAEDNTGTLAVGEVTITDPLQFGAPGAEVMMSPPVQIVFNSNGTYSVFDSDTHQPYPFLDGSSAEDRTLASDDTLEFNGFKVVIRGNPVAGDKISFSANSDAVSDNRNALQLSGLQQQSLVDVGEGGDNATYQVNYASLVAQVGTQTQVANINLQANETIMQSAQSIRDGISGVNLDEEAANLIKFQQQYQAASQVINTARSMFDTLLSSVG